MQPAVSNVVTTNNALSAALTSPSSSKGAIQQNQVDFMSLLVAQLKNQSPMDPTNSDQMMQEMAAMQTATEVSGMRTDLKSWSQVQGLASATSMIGHNASVIGVNGLMMQGPVTSVSFKNNAITVNVMGNDYPLNQILQVQ